MEGFSIGHPPPDLLDLLLFFIESNKFIDVELLSLLDILDTLKI